MDWEGFGNFTITLNPACCSLSLPLPQILISEIFDLAISTKEVQKTSCEMSYELICLHCQLATHAPCGNKKGVAILELFLILKSLAIDFIAPWQAPLLFIRLVVIFMLWFFYMTPPVGIGLCFQNSNLKPLMLSNVFHYMQSNKHEFYYP